MPPAGPGDGADGCPVDHKTREKWLEAVKSPTAERSIPSSPTAEQLKKAETNAKLLEELTPQLLRMPHEQRMILLQQYQELRSLEQQHALGGTRFSLDQLRWISKTQPKSPKSPPPPSRTTSLPKEREVSSIPRATHTNHDRHPLNSAESAALPANSEADSGHDNDSGNWIYPSQEMFFAAMKRKGYNPQHADMSTIVPIHNAVNEKAWSQILEWEKDRGGEACGGPKLVSFSGDSKALTPRARWKSLWGYQKPFDRHDWVVDRCGKKIDYVIDFYSGKADDKGSSVPLSFYLDVRPKLNNWDGIVTRIGRAVGL